MAKYVNMILRPNGAGSVPGPHGTEWAKLSDALSPVTGIALGDYDGSSATKPVSRFALGNVTAGTREAIAGVQIFAQVQSAVGRSVTVGPGTFYLGDDHVRVGFKSPAHGDQTVNDTLVASSVVRTDTQSRYWSINPWTQAPWTIADVNQLELWADLPKSTATNPTINLTDLYVVITISPVPEVPFIAVPGPGQTITTATPILSADMYNEEGIAGAKVEWQFARDTAFTTGVRTLSDTPNITYYNVTRPNGTGPVRRLQAFRPTSAAEEFRGQGTWYARARAGDLYGQWSSWSNTTTFTFQHQPSAAPVTPIDAQYVLYESTTRLAWAFSDPAPTDAQIAYQIIVERNDTFAEVVNTGKVNGSVTEARLAIPSAMKDVSLQWRVMVWDQDDMPSAWSQTQIFRVVDGPTVTLVSPVQDGSVDNARPATTWTFSATSNRFQRTYRAVYRKTSDNSIVWDTGVKTSRNVTDQPLQNVLANGGQYSLTLTVTDSSGIEVNRTATFTVTYIAPDVPTLSVDDTGYDDPTRGYINLDWAGAASDPLFYAWRVYRKGQLDLTWEMLGEYGNSIRSYRDWTASSNLVYEYALTQLADRSGSLLESPIVASLPARPASTHYWLIAKDNELYNFRLHNVNGDSFTDEYEMEIMTIINRGRRVEYGTHLGKSGTLSAQLRDNSYASARVQKMQMEMLRNKQVTYLIRDPYGDILTVALGAPQVTRIAGSGLSEHCDVSVTYTEVS